MGRLHLLNGQRDSGKSVWDREDGVSKGTAMVGSGSGRRTRKALNARAEIVGLGWRDLTEELWGGEGEDLVTDECGERKEREASRKTPGLWPGGPSEQHGPAQTQEGHGRSSAGSPPPGLTDSAGGSFPVPRGRPPQHRRGALHHTPVHPAALRGHHAGGDVQRAALHPHRRRGPLLHRPGRRTLRVCVSLCHPAASS